MNQQKDDNSFVSKEVLTIRAGLEFLAIACGIFLITYFGYCYMNRMLTEALENSVERSVRTVAYELNKRFNLEITYLKNQAEKVEIGQIAPNDIITFLENINGNHSGIISSRGNIIAGNTPPESIIAACESVVKENKPIVKYLRNVALIFAVPFQYNGETCVLFDYYRDYAVSEHFKTMIYNGDGTVILLNDLENWAVIAEGVPPLINTHPDMDDAWESLGEKIGYDSVTDTLAKDCAAICYSFQDKPYFVYMASVSEKYHFSISGYVPFQSVAVGFQAMYTGMLVGFSLIALVLIMAARMIYKSSENKRLKQENFLVNHAAKNKSDFLSNMSHEIRTPINAILGMDEMILRESKDKNILEYAENLKSAGNSLLSIVNDILDFSKIEAGKMEIIPVEYALSSVLNDLVNMIKPRADKKGLKIEVNANTEIPSIIYGDEIRIKQVVTNILTNAVKYTEKGSVTLSVDFEKRDEESIWLKFSVADTGIGIKPEDLSKLFSAFERIEEKRNRTIEGTGLGMNITQQLLAMMNTKLEVASVYGEGSTFSFKVAQKIINAEPMGNFADAFKNAEHKKYHEKFTAPDAKILVVDDTAMNLTVVKGLLKQTKIQIDTAESGYDTLKMVAAKHYDVIFLDHRMPGMDGIETLQEMKKLADSKCLDTPVISLTANAISGAREQYIAAGFKDYLTKPINAGALENMLIKYLPPELVKISDDTADNSADESVDEIAALPDWLTKVDDINTKAGIEHCGGADSYMDALTVFANAVTSGADEIQGYFDNDDWKNYTTKVHALKSTARVIGAAELSERAKRLEDAGNAGYVDEIQKDTPELLKLYRSYAEKLSALIKVEVEDDTKPPIDPDALAEAYETLQEVATTFDYDTLTFVIQSLEEYKLPAEDSEKIKALKAAANNLDWEEIKKIVAT
ncbi:MAG: response regulator [Selenomonadaceae bacterium]|nr:response regulator [Selenomonadaceae bacterium]